MKTLNIVAFYLMLGCAVVDGIIGWWWLSAYCIICAWINLEAIKRREAYDAAKSDSKSVE